MWSCMDIVQTRRVLDVTKRKICEFFRSLVALIFHHVISGNQVNILIGMYSLKFQQQQVKQS